MPSSPFSSSSSPPPSASSVPVRMLHCCSIVCWLLLAFLPCSNAVMCLNCRTLEDQLICDDPCEGDICALWSFREMSTEHRVQGCLTGPDLRDSGHLRMGCRRNRVDALLCLCNSTNHCNMDEEALQRAHPNEQPMLPSDIRCQSRTSASFIRRQMVRPYKHSCHSDLCFFTQSNSTGVSAGDPRGQPPSTESTTSRNCGHQLEFNFDLLLGPVWPGHGLHSEACYRLETGRDLLIGCSCSNNDCNREMPYPIGPRGRPLVKCHLGPVQQASSTRLAANANQSRSAADPGPHCFGHFCFVQREIFHGYGDHWTSGCLSANESAARAKLRVGYRNILGVEQWLCATDLCNEPMLRAASGEAAAIGQRRRAGKTVDGPIAGGRGKAAKSEGGRVQAQLHAMAKKRKELAAADVDRPAAAGNGGVGKPHKLQLQLLLQLQTFYYIALFGSFALCLV